MEGKLGLSPADRAGVGDAPQGDSGDLAKIYELAGGRFSACGRTRERRFVSTLLDADRRQ
ncbi:MAG: hypothetical protein QNK37_26430 [Acidobacteriota bacterium]|nr:hypothetical protein [Acidobacteriota bacterium]